MNYGEAFDTGFIPDKQHIYDMFTSYYNNPKMTKLKDIEQYSMYVAKAYCLLNKECRYLIVIKNIDKNPPGYIQQLKDIDWTSLQTRSLSENYEVATINYTPSMKGPLTAQIEKISTTKEASTYKCEKFPLVITLLHTDKKTAEIYQQKGNIISALETYETIITFN